MTLYQIAEQIQRFVKNGVIRGRDTLDADDYLQLAILARDYVLFELKKGNEMLFMDLQVTNAEHIFKIKQGKVELPTGYNVQGISGAELLDSSEESLQEELLIPMPQGGNPILTRSLFAYYLIGQKNITFKNLPQKAKNLKIWNVCGTSPDDEVNNAIAFAIFQQIMKLGQASEQMMKDTAADGSGMSDIQREQIKQLINNPNGIIAA